MSEAVVRVPSEEVPPFQEWLASQTEEVTHRVSDGVKTNGAEDAIYEIKIARQKLEAVQHLLEQGQEAANAEENAVYRGDAEILLWNCHAMAGDYISEIGALDTPEPWDFAAAAEAVGPLAHWIEQGREVQETLSGEAVA